MAEQLPAVDFADRPLAVGDKVVIIGKHNLLPDSLAFGRITVFSGEEVCIDTGRLCVRRGERVGRLASKPDRVRFATVALFAAAAHEEA